MNIIVPSIVLLPGLDGTAKLFDRFVAAAPPHLTMTAVALPAEPLTYDQLADRIVSTLPAGDIIVIAESFSGPLAVALAERRRLAALIFCNSFVAAPRRRALRWLVFPILFKLPAPSFLLRRYMLGAAADAALVREVAAVVASVPAAVLAFRMKSTLAVDKTAAFARTSVPALYVRGTEDRLVAESSVHRMKTARPISTAHVPGPHLLLQANPAGAWKAIAAFLDFLLPENRQSEPAHP